MIRLVALVAMAGCLADPAAAQGVGFGFGAGAEPRHPAPRIEYPYPANPQYQYPYPYDESLVRPDRRCRYGQVRHQGQCKVARPLALPF
jgi:hypothetical protein